MAVLSLVLAALATAPTSAAVPGGTPDEGRAELVAADLQPTPLFPRELPLRLASAGTEVELIDDSFEVSWARRLAGDTYGGSISLSRQPEDALDELIENNRVRGDPSHVEQIGGRRVLYLCGHVCGFAWLEDGFTYGVFGQYFQDPRGADERDMRAIVARLAPLTETRLQVEILTEVAAGGFALVAVRGASPGQALRVRIGQYTEPPDNCCMSTPYPPTGATPLFAAADGSLVATVPVEPSYARCALTACGPDRPQHPYLDGEHVRVAVSADDGSAFGSASVLISEAPSPDLPLLRRFAPRLYFDRSERGRPVDIGAFLGSGTASTCEQALPPCAGPGELFSLAELQNRRERWLRYDPNLTGDRTRIYGHVVRGQVGRFTLVDYWFFYRNNDFPHSGPFFDHQGDWEGMYVAVDESAPGGGFAFAGIASHEHTFRYLPGVLRCAAPGATDTSGVHEQPCPSFATRLNVYVAQGSHAGYPRRCSDTPCSQTDSDPPDGDYGGEAGWDANEVPAAVAQLPAAAWNAWPGRWGSSDNGTFGTSPGGPRGQLRYNRPFEATRCSDRWSEELTCDGEARSAAIGSDRRYCDAWFGSSLAAATCDPAALRQALADGSINVPQPTGIAAPGAANGHGVSQLAGELATTGVPVAVTATDGLVYARSRTRDGEQAESLYDARAGGLTLSARLVGGRPRISATDAARRTVRAAATRRSSRRPAARPRIRVIRRTRRTAFLRVVGARRITVTIGRKTIVVTVPASRRLRLVVTPSTRRIVIRALPATRPPSSGVTIRLPRAPG